MRGRSSQKIIAQEHGRFSGKRVPRLILNVELKYGVNGSTRSDVNEMTQEIIDHIKTALNDMAFDGIKKAYAGGSKMGTFILGSCFIDCMAGFVYGRPAEGNDFKTFVREYLPSYDDEKLWNDLRCRLVHDYSEGGSYVFVNSLPDLHRCQTVEGDRTVINLENFIDDLEGAMRKLLNEIETVHAKREKAFKRYRHKIRDRELGILQVGKLSTVVK
jgi:hypothetical protein